MEVKKDEKLNVIISLIVYAFMFLLVGSSVIISVVGAIYVSKNPDIDLLLLFEGLSGLKDPLLFTPEMFKAYAYVGGYGNMITYLITTIIVVFFMRRLIVNDSIKFKNNLLRNIILLPVSAVLFYIITIVVDSYIIGPLVGESTNQNTIVSIINGGGALPMFIAVVICAPLVEELIYRKAIFELFRNRSIIFCYIISTILFVLPHMISTNFIISKWVLLCVP